MRWGGGGDDTRDADGLGAHGGGCDPPPPQKRPAGLQVPVGVVAEGGGCHLRQRGGRVDCALFSGVRFVINEEKDRGELVLVFAKRKDAELCGDHRTCWAAEDGEARGV